MVTTPPAEPAKPEPVLITSGENSFWQEGEVTDAAGANADVTVNDTSVLQDWHGFGGTFNEKGWEALAKLSQEDRDLALKMLFDKNDGAAFTYGRIPIGSSDYARDRYSLAPTAGDFEMADFSIDRDKEELIPYIKAAMAVNPDIKFWGSPWSPPPWMKDNNAFDRGNMKNDADTLKAHALYLSRFVEDYGKEGINILAVHPQNEPGFGQDYPSCGWSGSQMADYIANYLGPTFEERSITAEIWMGTMSNDQVDSGIAQTVMGNAAAKAYIKGMGLQWGMEKFAQQYVNDYDVPIFQTEHRCGNYPWEGNYKADKAPNDFAYALESWDLLTGWITKGVNGYSAWNMVLDTKGASLDTVRPWNQNALLIVDTAAGKLIPTPTYYVFRHLAQYVEPGAVRVATQGGNALAFKNPDGSIVTVLHATGSQAATTTLSVAGKSLQFSIPARGWATVNVQPE
jgi:glucosylceramidase